MTFNNSGRSGSFGGVSEPIGSDQGKYFFHKTNIVNIDLEAATIGKKKRFLQSSEFQLHISYFAGTGILTGLYSETVSNRSNTV